MKRAVTWLSFGLVAVVLVIGAALIFGTSRVPPPVEGVGVGTALEAVNYSDLPPLARIAVRGGYTVAYRAYNAKVSKIAIVIHGSSGNSASMHALSKALRVSGVARVYALDMAGHGGTGRRGDIRYIGQLEDDLADVIDALRARHKQARIVIVGFSAGAGFSIRFAGSRYGKKADAYIFLSPYIHHASPTNRPCEDGWAVPHIPRIIALTVLNRIGITAFNYLRAVSFRVKAVQRANLTQHYSYRLALNFRPHEDYVANLRRITKPVMLIAGTDDKLFIAKHYRTDVAAHVPEMKVRIVKGIGHIGMIVDETALRAVVAAVRGLP